MSRLIVKNLPNGFTEKRFRELFSQKGHITDVQLKYTKDGKFRKFGFVGYQSEQEAAKAAEFFNSTCIDTSRITVETCAALGAETKPQAWSKYAKDSSNYKKLHGIDEESEKQSKQKESEKEKKKNKKERLDDIFGEHKNDPKFIEFMKIHDKGNDIWDNDLGLMEQTEDDIIPKKRDDVATESKEQPDKEKPSASNPFGYKKSKKDDDEDDQEEADENDESENEEDSENAESEKVEDGVKLADQSISDLEYLKSLKNKATVKKEVKSGEMKVTDLFTIKIRDIPFKTKRKDIIKFFKPVKAFSIRLPTRKHGFCYVGFKTEKEFKKAMLKNRSFLSGKQVTLIDFTEKNKEAALHKENPDAAKQEKTVKNSKWAKQEDALKNEEDICESGRIFFRNLSYTVNEEQLQELFEKYGPVTEISLPIDPVTRKIKGFGTVTFVMPEHAVQAFSELDGSTFQGRLLHLIPGKSRDDDEKNINTDGMSFKQKKEMEQKKTAGSSHNWNTLFMGADAVANTLVKSYKTSKEQIMDTAGSGSNAAVRLALGETELIIEMRKFLEANDVVLDAFDQTPKKRSKTVILAKNLPAETHISEIQPLFAKFGLLGRIVLPPSGVTAIIEFLEPSEAKKAFSKLAYTKFKNLPLYLEWAPENTFKTVATKPMEIDTVKVEETNATESKSSKPNPFAKGGAGKEQMKSKTNENGIKKSEDIFESYVINDPLPSQPENGVESEEDDTEPEPGTTLFLRNLKFATEVESVRNHFKHIGKIHHIQIATKKDPENPRNKIPLGYGFIQFKLKKSAEKALKDMQITNIDGNSVELKRSDRTLQTEVHTNRKTAKALKQTGSKILVRNIAFQAKVNEVRDLFAAFGELKSIRIPKKMAPGEDAHRGFGFVDFISKSDAKKAFDALSHSTHLYGRRLVLEWAAADEGVEELRKRTAEHFHGSQSAAKRNKKAVFDASNITKIATNSDDDE